MQRFINVFIQRPVFAAMIILMMVVVGLSALGVLGVDRFPSVDLPTVSIRTTLPGAAPEEVESEVTRRIEDVVNTVDGIDELRSITNEGVSNVILTFRLDRNIEAAAQDVRDKVSTVLKQLPDEVDPPVVSKFDNDSTPVMTYAIYGDKSLRELTEIADKLVKVGLERSKGVGEVALVGGAERTINIDVDADRLASYGLPMSAIADAVQKENAEVPGGNLTGPMIERSLRTMGRFTEASQFANLAIAKVNNTVIQLKDVAQVTDGAAEQRSSARLNGEPSVSLDIRRQSGANTIEVIEAVKANAARLQAQLPPGVRMELLRDQSDYIYAALHEIDTHLLLGSIFACLVVFAFTRSWRSTIIAGVAIPTSVVSTFAVMWWLGFTLNSVTMLALVLMVGIVIDDAIVVLENIFRFVEEKGVSPFEAARQGTAEIALAVLATTLSLMVIFVPISFMSSISGRFLYQFGITAAVAVGVSLIVSFVLTPTLSARMLGKEAQRLAEKAHSGQSHGSRGGFYGALDRLYTAMLRFVMRFRILTAIVALAIVASSIPLFSIVKQGYFPQGADEAEFQLTVDAPNGTSFASMDDVMRSVEADLSKMPEVITVLSNTGGGFNGAVNSGTVYVRIPPHEQRYWSVGRIFQGLRHGDPGLAFRGNYTQNDVMEKIRAALGKYKAQGLRIAVRNFAGFNIGGGSFDIDVSIHGPSLEKLAAYSTELVKRTNAIGGMTGVDNTLKLDSPELRVEIDRARARDLKISPNDIGQALRVMVGGDEEISRFLDPQTNEDYDVRLRLAEKYRQDPSQVPNLLLGTSDGRLIELQNIATFKPALASARIDRLDRNRDARVRGFLVKGASLQDRIAAIKGQIEEMHLDPEYAVSIRGAGREFETTYHQFVLAMLLSIVFMYMILASNYEHLVHPITILLSLPLAIPFALLSLVLAGEQLNLYSALGILVLFGVVKKNSILQVDHMNGLRAKGLPRYEAVIEGCRDRLRPILMTTLALVAGMLPLWLGTGPGAEERRAVAVVVIGGQTLSLLLTLLVTPVAYTLLDDLGAMFGKRTQKLKGGAGGVISVAVTPVTRHPGDE